MGIFMVLTVSILAAAFLLKARPAEAHCDTLSGPVIQAARKAFDQGKVYPVLKWVKSDDEAQVQKAFELARKVRPLGPEASALAESFFFETLVRIHRAGEGAPFEGLMPDSSVPPVVRKADAALESGEVSDLADRISSHVKREVETRFKNAWEKKQAADDSPEKGREFVGAYISFVHYVEGIHEMTMGGHTHGEHHH